MPRKKFIPMLFTLDTETYGLQGDIKRIALYNGKSIKYGYTFSDVEPILDFYYSLGFLPYIYVHNFAFDFRKIPEIFRKGNVNWAKSMMINGRFAKLSCKHYVFRDSWQLLPSSLESLSKDFGVEHAKIDLWEAVQKAYPNKYKDKEDYFINCDVNDPLYIEYLGYDVMSLYEVMEKLMELSGIDLEHFISILSTSSLSRYLFKNGWKDVKFLTNGVSDFSQLCSCKMWHSNVKCKGGNLTFREVENIIRKGSYGGRTEVFKIYTGLPTEGYTALHYDVNSEYPFVMHEHNFPIGEPFVYTKNVKSIFEEWLKYGDGLGFLECDVYIPKQHIPPLPVHKEKTAFFCGHISGVWSYYELKYAIENCGVVIEKYKTAIHFAKTFPVFKNFIGTMYKLKEDATKKGQQALRTFAKLVQNVAFGYTIMNRDDKTELKGIDDRSYSEIVEEYGEELKNFSEDYGFIEVKADVDARYIQPQIGAYVTSYARVLLLDAMRKVESSGGDVYYCDTDSVVSSIPFPHEIVDSTKLGAWDLESIVYEGIFIQPKVYSEISITTKGKFKTTKKFKGIKKAVITGFDIEKYQEIYDELKSGIKDAIVIERNRLTLRGFSYITKKGLDLNAVSISDKAINLKNMQKRIMHYSENETEPYYFETLTDFEKFSFVKRTHDYFKQGALINMN